VVIVPHSRANRQVSRQLLAFGVACVLLVACGAATATTAPAAGGEPSASGASVESPNPIASSEAVLPAEPTATATTDQDDGAAPPDPASTEVPPPPAASVDRSAPAAGRLPGEPNPTLTPGAFNPAVTQATIRATICVSGWTATIRPSSSYTTGLKVQQIGVYGYADTSTASYEEDHLIPLELGGAPADPHNLWPEPYSITLANGSPAGAHVKDGYETALKRQVCAGTLTLAAARARIGVHWVHAYYGIPLATTSGATPKPAPAAATPRPTTKPAASGPLTVAFVNLTSPISRGSTATATVRTGAGAACTIVVAYKSGPSKAAGLGSTTASSSGLASWHWTIGSRTTLGSWPVTVTCSAGGASARATRSLVVQ
jgi:hypothetical protein